MKVLIDISENSYQILEDMKDCGLGSYNEAILNGKVISDEATNKEVAEIIFPNTNFAEEGAGYKLSFEDILPKEWLDAPYEPNITNIKEDIL